jgi:hypothetical protein
VYTLPVTVAANGTSSLKRQFPTIIQKMPTTPGKNYDLKDCKVSEIQI